MFGSKILITLLLGAATTAQANYAEHPQGKAFIESMVEKGFERDFVAHALSQAEHREDIIELMTRPAEGVMTWERYRGIFVEDRRINQAVEFHEEYQEILDAVQKETGVDKSIILSIMAVETRLGRVMGKHRVIDALSTLAFDYPKRSEFFTKELAKYFELVRREGVDPLSLKGSYAGAMGWGQFIPSSYLAYAVDQDNDGKVDIWNNPVDAIGSVANYFKAHGWRAGEPVSADFTKPESDIEHLVSTSLKPSKSVSEWENDGIIIDGTLKSDQLATLMKFDESYYVGLHNFYVITRYNHSKLYARAVYELSRAIDERIN